MIRAFDRKNGRIAWAYDIRKDGDQRQFHGDALIADRLLIIGTDGNIGHVYAFDTTTGNVRWKYKVEDGGVASDIVRLGRSVYAVTLGDDLISLDVETGKLNWTFQSNFSGHDFHWTPPAAVSEGRVYFGGQDGVLYALASQSGKTIWKSTLDSPISTSIAIQGNELYVGTAKAHLYRVNSNSGDVTGDLKTEWQPRWNLVEGDNCLVVFLGDEVLASVDLSLKRINWSAEASREWTSARPYMWHGMVLAGNRRELVALRATNGSRQWSHEFREVVRGVGVSEDNTLYVGSLKGPIFAYTPTK